MKHNIVDVLNFLTSWANIGGIFGILKWGNPWVKIQLFPSLARGAERLKSQKLYSLSRSAGYSKLYSVSKNYPPELISRGDISGFPLLKF